VDYKLEVPACNVIAVQQTPRGIDVFVESHSMVGHCSTCGTETQHTRNTIRITSRNSDTSFDTDPKVKRPSR
jgi:hypothetical protein